VAYRAEENMQGRSLDNRFSAAVATASWGKRKPKASPIKKQSFLSKHLFFSI